MHINKKNKIMKLKDFYSKQDIELNNDVNMYVCGPTVYSEPHIGNMRPIIIFDILNKVLSMKGNVNFVHNITDVDDKIINKAIEEGVSESEISTRYTDSYISLLEQLNIKTPTSMPKVTDHIEGIINFIVELINNNNAYEVNGSVYFSVDSYPNYGNLLGVDINEFNDGEENKDKRNPKDFALWKNTSVGINWSSPWGDGRPGWHTECAYFIKESFGSKGLDIHGGGIDLKFPHHINEASQFECSCSINSTSKVWSYVGHINLGDTKMSKSLGNIISAKDFIKEHGALTLRMVMLQTSMLNPISLTDDVINNASKSVNKIRNSLIKSFINLSIEGSYTYKESQPSIDVIKCLENDLDYVGAITYINEQIKIINSGILGNEHVLEELISNLSILGFEFEINYNTLRDKIKEAKDTSDYESLDKYRKEIIR